MTLIVRYSYISPSRKKWRFEEWYTDPLLLSSTVRPPRESPLSFPNFTFLFTLFLSFPNSFPLFYFIHPPNPIFTLLLYSQPIYTFLTITIAPHLPINFYSYSLLILLHSNPSFKTFLNFINLIYLTKIPNPKSQIPNLRDKKMYSIPNQNILPSKIIPII